MIGVTLITLITYDDLSPGEHLIFVASLLITSVSPSFHRRRLRRLG
jgi:hypothetical protein